MTVRTENTLTWTLRRCALAIAVFWAVPTFAQIDGFKDLAGLKPKPVPKPEFTTTLGPANARPGDEVTLAIKVKLPTGYYIYSTTGDFGGRTKITTGEKGLEPIDAEFTADHEPKTAFEPLFNVEVSKFYDQVTWKRRYRMAQDANHASVAVSGELSGQYCTAGTEDEPGNCVPIIPPYEFEATLADATESTSPRYEYEERPTRGKTNPALLKFNLSPMDAKPGDIVTLSITMELDEGWHTFSLTQKGEGGAPTIIDLTSVHGLKAQGDGFQSDHAPEIEKPLEDLVLEVHKERVTWSRELQVQPGVKPGQYGVVGTISYQTCKTSCIPPREVEFTLGDISLAPLAPAGRSSDVPPPSNVGAAKSAPPSAAAGAVAKRPQDQGLFKFLLIAIGFGFLSLLTPCVFPMIPITVSFFLKQSESEHHNPLLVALVFCASIIGTFSILGVGMAAAFGASNLNGLANNPLLNIFIGAVFVAFGFNMLGMFEIRVPSSLLTFTANKEQAGGYVGAMFMGLTFTLVSFTCTFAFAGSLLVAAAQGEYYWPIIGMAGFGTSFALPFFCLAMMPSLLKKLPKSGGWMNAVKVVMGLVELGAAIKFFSVADVAWNPTEQAVFDYTFVLVSWLVLSIVIALYLLGVFRLAHDTPAPGVSIGRLVVVIGFLALSGNLAVGLISPENEGSWIMDQVLAMAPPRIERVLPAAEGGSKTDLPEPFIVHHGVFYSLDVDKAISYAKGLNRPLFFDFTGMNCPNCRLMERKMAHPKIRSRLDKFVTVQLYADAVPLISERAEARRLIKRNIELQTQWFNDVTLPSYAVVTPDGKTILSSFFGNEQIDGTFAAFLDAGLKKWDEIQANPLAAANSFAQ